MCQCLAPVALPWHACTRECNLVPVGMVNGGVEQQAAGCWQAAGTDPEAIQLLAWIISNNPQERQELLCAAVRIRAGDRQQATLHVAVGCCGPRASCDC